MVFQLRSILFVCSFVTGSTKCLKISGEGCALKLFLLHFMAHLYMSPPRRAEIIVRAPCIRIHATSHCAELVSNRPKSSLRAIWYSKCNQIIRRQFHHTKNLKHTQENLTFAVYRLK